MTIENIAEKLIPSYTTYLQSGDVFYQTAHIDEIKDVFDMDDKQYNKFFVSVNIDLINKTRHNLTESKECTQSKDIMLDLDKLYYEQYEKLKTTGVADRVILEKDQIAHIVDCDYCQKEVYKHIKQHTECLILIQNSKEPVREF